MVVLLSKTYINPGCTCFLPCPTPRQIQRQTTAESGSSQGRCGIWNQVFSGLAHTKARKEINRQKFQEGEILSPVHIFQNMQYLKNPIIWNIDTKNYAKRIRFWTQTIIMQMLGMEHIGLQHQTTLFLIAFPKYFSHSISSWSIR